MHQVVARLQNSEQAVDMQNLPDEQVIQHLKSFMLDPTKFVAGNLMHRSCLCSMHKPVEQMIKHSCDSSVVLDDLSDMSINLKLDLVCYCLECLIVTYVLYHLLHWLDLCIISCAVSTRNYDSWRDMTFVLNMFKFVVTVLVMMLLISTISNHCP